jgi:nicotinate-nucleotide--dimethylbenzimidazole phosphoribosyltransferase
MHPPENNRSVDQDRDADRELATVRATARARLASLAKPPGSMGRLEDLAEALCVAQRSMAPCTTPRLHLVFCGDHAAASATSAWPSSVSALVARTLGLGGAVSSVLARRFDASTRVVDVALHGECGLEAGCAEGVEFHAARLVPGAKDIRHEDALSSEQFEACWRLGVSEAERAAQRGVRLLLPGEVGIGNTASAAAMAMLVLGLPVGDATGRGAGCDDAQHEAKRRAVAQAVARATERHAAPLERLRAVAGAELVAMAGALSGASQLGLTSVLDGALAAAAGLLARERTPGCESRWLASHLGAEPLHGHALESLGLQPWLAWDMRLGEGSGALLLLPLLDAAADLVRSVATLDEALGRAPGELRP